ncbi:MAG: methyltransferase domain-containing protein [Actinobacteria bacterium]|nr:methyltransferase domain-containing protein [Actinomycetota bacterium]
MTSTHHPVFARVYARLAKADLARGGAEHRVELLEGLAGRVIEVGCGHGPNFAFYPSAVSELVAVEPEPYLWAKAMKAAERAPLNATVVEGTADRLPGAGYDAGVASLVLCSVPDQDEALAELFRVIKPGGELRYYEHVRATDERLARIQRTLDRTIWPFVGGGCHCSRDTAAAIERAGFVLDRHQSFMFTTCPLDRMVAPHILGRALRP